MTLKPSAPWCRPLVAAVIGSLMSLGAAAQTPGVYSGSTDQGWAFSLTVAATPGGGREVTSLTVNYTLACERTATPVYLGSATNGHFPIDAAGRFTAEWLWDRDWFRTAGQFAPDGSVSGLTAWALAAVTKPAPHLAELCASPDVGWSAGAGAAATAAAPARLDLRIERRFDRAGRLVQDRTWAPR